MSAFTPLQEAVLRRIVREEIAAREAFRAGPMSEEAKASLTGLIRTEMEAPRGQ